VSLALSYAHAIYEASEENREGQERLSFQEQLEKEMEFFGKLLTISSDAKKVFLSPLTSRREKLLCIEVFGKHFQLSALFLRFLQVLAKKNRFHCLEDIRKAFHRIRLEKAGFVCAQLEVARVMEKDDFEALKKSLEQKFGNKMAFQVVVDPALLAGMKVTVNAVTYDQTLRSYLSKLRNRVLAGA